MNIFFNEKYQTDLRSLLDLNFNWEKLKGSSFLITGATGLIGHSLIDFLLFLDKEFSLDIKIFGTGRNKNKFYKSFEGFCDSSKLNFIECDLSKDFDLQNVFSSINKIDYVVHLASNTHPLLYSTQPVETITTNVFGLYNLLNLSSVLNVSRFVFASSVEVYGENRGDEKYFSENYCGYINSNTLRAGYPESKRLCESLCQAFIAQKKLDVVIPRLSRVYGPTMQMDDSKALSQFIKKALNREDIVLKSEGNQFYSYTYVLDAVSAVLCILLNAPCGEVYNVSSPASDITLKELAELLASFSNTSVVFDLPDETERKGYSTATQAVMDNKKILSLGWKPLFDIKNGLQNTLEILRALS